MEHYRVRASFNANLSPITSSFQTKPAAYSQISLLPNKPPVSSFLQPNYTPNSSALEDAEISIFDAQRYFNESQQNQFNGGARKTIILNGIVDSCNASTNPRDSSVSSVDGYGRNCRNRSLRATPTSSSEASWNSQSGLLSNPRGSMPVSVRSLPTSNEKRRTSLSMRRRILRGSCPCYGKKSVDVEEKYAETKSPPCFSSPKGTTVTSTTSTDNCSPTKEVEQASKLKISARSWAKDSKFFSPEKPFPAEIGHRIVNSGRPFVESAGFSFPIIATLPAATTGSDYPTRDSLDVFQPVDDLTNFRESAEFPRRKLADAAGDDDAASDTSSDLFEIESFSTHSAYRRRDSLDEFPKLAGNAAARILQFQRSLEETAASIAPSECYAPSEVSVEWSVTTAEGGYDRASLENFSSAASDYDDAGYSRNGDDRVMMTGNGGGNRKKGTGGLLSCRCENSVNVGPNPVRIGAEQRRVGTVELAVEPDRGLGMSRFGLEKAELFSSHSTRMNRAVQTRQAGMHGMLQ